MRSTGKPTIRDIAAKVGCSINTVSLALKASPLVSADTREKVLAAARALGYVRNSLAGSLRSGESHTVAVLFGDLANLFFAQRISALGRVLNRYGYQLLVLPTNEDESTELNAVHTAISHRVDGVILCPCQQSMNSVRLLLEQNMPCVLLGRQFPEALTDAVVWDDCTGGLLATQHLIEAGCRRILHLSTDAQISSAIQRRKGYEQAIRKAGLSPLYAQTATPFGGVVSALEQMGTGGIAYDGIFAFSDLMAMEAADWLLRQGVRIPDNVALVGFDDVLSAARIPFSLTSIANDRETEAEKTVELLLKRMKQPGAAPKTLSLPVELIPRNSSRFGN